VLFGGLLHVAIAPPGGHEPIEALRQNPPLATNFEGVKLTVFYRVPDYRF
jgi:hypothetical protein